MTWANLITGFRLFLFVIFIYLVHQGFILEAATVFAVAWGLDAVDGWVARKLGEASAWGYVFDKVADRTIIIGGLFVLIVYAVIPIYGLFIFTKDVVAMLGGVRQREAGKLVGDMGQAGKLMTVGQGVAILWLMLVLPGGSYLVGVVAVAGGIVGIKYLLNNWTVEKSG